jgi:hypothetical protein
VALAVELEALNYRRQFHSEDVVAAWFDSLLADLQGENQTSTDVRSTGGDLMTVLVNGRSFIAENEKLTDTGLGMLVKRGGELSFSQYFGAVDGTEYGATRDEYLELLRKDLRPHAAVIEAIDDAVRAEAS